MPRIINDTFEANTASTTGSLDGEYLWSNPGNWSTGALPFGGNNVTLGADGVDDLGSLSLTSITEAPGAELFYIAGASLTVGTLAVNTNGELYAGILGVATPVTVSVSSLVGSGSILGAVGGTFIDLSTTDPGEHYFAGYGGAVTLHAAPASSSILEFGGGYTDTIALEALPTGVYSAELEGLAVGDVLELPGSAVEGISFGASSLAITTSAGIFDFSSVQYDNSVSGYFATHNAADGLEAVTFTGVTCYVAGTKVMTSHGERAVESLQIGDRLKTLHSGYQKIKWIGTRSYGGRFIAGNKAALPICIKQHAFADNVPIRDLFVSPGHAICIAGALVQAARLVNGVSVVQAERVESVTYYHIEMENHEIIFAENCPAETFMGEGFRQRFQNAAEFARVYPGAAATEISCLKRLDSGFQLHAIQRRIAARAGVELPDIAGPGKLRGYVDQAGPNFCTGWAQEILAPEAPVCLDIMAAGRRVGRVLANGHRADLANAGFGSGDHGFEFILPAGTTGRIEAVRISDRSELARTDDAAAQAA